jgi:acetylornithine deacetylase/succinyl-diaminopimelate desuccinylase-like protein/predicted glutamine amidotransferase
VTRPSRSIIQQSFDARERLSGDASTPGYLNGDGFGLGWYSADPLDPLPCVYRQARPAWNDGNLAMIAEKIYSPVLFAHVRAASPGMDVSETTCHPFRFGRYLWMHNGGLGGFHAMRRILLPMLNEEAFDFAVTNGSSDSALCFAVFLNMVPDKMIESSPDEMRERLDTTIVILRNALRDANIQEMSLLNFVVSDGDSLLASRVVIDPKNPDAPAASLYHASGNRYVADSGSPKDYHMVHVDRRATLAIVSSEPLTECRDDWVAVPKDHILVITSSLHILQCEVSRHNASISRVLANLRDDDIARYRNQNAALEALTPLGVLAAPLPLSPSSVTGEHHANGHVRSPIRSISPRLPQHVGLGMPTSPMQLPLPSETMAQHESVLQRAISSQTIMASNGLHGGASLPEPPPAAILTPGPASSTIRYKIQTKDHRILSMAVCGPYLCSGTQDGSIRVWNIEERSEAIVLRRHNGAVLGLAIDESGAVLVSAASDSQIGVWKMTSPDLFQCLRIVQCSGSGDVFSVAVIHGFIYAGFADSIMRRLDDDIDKIIASTGASSSDGSECILAPMTLSPVLGSKTLGRSDSTSGSPAGAGTAEGAGQGDGIQELNHYGYVFSLASCMDGRLLCTGCGDGLVRVWDVATGMCRRVLEGHAGAVLALAVTEIDGGTLLFSGSRDGTVKVWDAESGFLCKRTIRRHSDDVVSCVSSTDVVLSGSADGQVYIWCARTLLCLAQYRNSSLQAASISLPQELIFLASEDSIDVRDLVQFDVSGNRASAGACGLLNPKPVATNGAIRGCDFGLRRQPSGLTRSVLNVITEPGLQAGSEHSTDKASREGDEETFKTLVPGLPNEVVLASARSSFIDRVGDLTRDANGHWGPLESGNGIRENCGRLTVANATDECNEAGIDGSHDPVRIRRVEERLMQDVLARFVSFATVSGTDDHREDCWQGAKYLTTLLEDMGASVKMITPEAVPQTNSVENVGARGQNPIVLARFKSTVDDAQTLAFYGHYDTMPAGELKDWNSDPWTLTAVDGHYYGRGTTDNKGPILAMVFAIKSLLDSSKDGLAVNVVLVLEGEGEQSNIGFRDAVAANKHWFGDTTMILTSNSYWLGEERPCITYGMRGVVDMTVSVTGGSRNLHSGVDGGAIFEPVSDLLGILSTLVDSHGMALVPGFYDDVRPLTDEDHARLTEVQFELSEYRARTGVEKFTSSSPAELLESRWRRPSVSVASLDTSNKDRVHSVMPREASAKLSIRFVPDQDPDLLVKAIRSHFEIEFRKRRSRNKLAVACVGKGDWWLGDPKCEEFQLAERAIKRVWGVDPLYVCEGGTMPIFSFLSNTLQAPVVQVPLGQASDGAHLPNERIRAVNLHRGKDVLRCIVGELSDRRWEGSRR